MPNPPPRHKQGFTVFFTCRICGLPGEHPSYQAREMMFGLGDSFVYFQCVGCLCLQIDEIPADLSRYYPPQYYSFQEDPETSYRRLFESAVRRLRDRYAIERRGIAGRYLLRKYPRPEIEALAALGLRPDTRILDVGSGRGSLLFSLRELGFKNLLGIDPHLDQSVTYRNGLRIERRELESLEGEWDVIMFHHSLEHIPDQRGVLMQAARLLSCSGTCLIRIPVVSSFAWREYGVDWVQLDAPRHFYLHSVASLELLAQQAGLVVSSLTFDSTSFQCWGSEQYRCGIPLRSARSYDTDPKASIFSKSEIRRFRLRAEALNRAGEGDQAAFFLRRPETRSE